MDEGNVFMDRGLFIHECHINALFHSIEPYLNAQNLKRNVDYDFKYSLNKFDNIETILYFKDPDVRTLFILRVSDVELSEDIFC